jgi:hypothetical protein
VASSLGEVADPANDHRVRRCARRTVCASTSPSESSCPEARRERARLSRSSSAFYATLELTLVGLLNVGDRLDRRVRAPTRRDAPRTVVAIV